VEEEVAGVEEEARARRVEEAGARVAAVKKVGWGGEERYPKFGCSWAGIGILSMGMNELLDRLQ
jgi:hypothetical protein